MVITWQYPFVKTHLTVNSKCVPLIIHKLYLTEVDLIIKHFMGVHYFKLKDGLVVKMFCKLSSCCSPACFSALQLNLPSEKQPIVSHHAMPSLCTLTCLHLYSDCSFSNGSHLLFSFFRKPSLTTKHWMIIVSSTLFVYFLSIYQLFGISKCTVLGYLFYCLAVF